MNYNQNIELDFSAQIIAAEKQKKTLNKPFRTPDGPKKFSVYVKNEKGNIVKVNFGDPNMEIKRDDPNRRKNFRARHQCDTNPGPKWKARYWSCRMWESKKSVKDYIKGSIEDCVEDWNGETLWDKSEILAFYPELSQAQEMEEDESEENELEEYKAEFRGMTLSSLKSIKAHVDSILAASENPDVQENMSESWLQGKVALAEDYILTIHNYLLFNKESEEGVNNNESYEESIKD